MNGTSSYIYYTCTEGTLTAPALTAPAPGSTLNGSSATFDWTAGVGQTACSLGVGTTGTGSCNVYNSEVTSALSAEVTSIPTSGATLYVQLGYRMNNVWSYFHYTYKESGAPHRQRRQLCPSRRRQLRHLPVAARWPDPSSTPQPRRGCPCTWSAAAEGTGDVERCFCTIPATSLRVDRPLSSSTVCGKHVSTRMNTVRNKFAQVISIKQANCYAVNSSRKHARDQSRAFLFLDPEKENDRCTPKLAPPSPAHHRSQATHGLRHLSGHLVPSVPSSLCPSVRKRTRICALLARIQNIPFDIPVFIFRTFQLRLPQSTVPRRLAAEHRAILCTLRV